MAREIGRRESTQPMESLKRDLTQAVREMKLDDSQLTIGLDGKGTDAGTGRLHLFRTAFGDAYP